MSYQLSNWKQTYKNRTDLTGLLTHLTRRKNNLTGIDVLINILKEKTLRGSKEGYIIGGQEVVCFQEVPLYSVAENAINHVEEFEAGEVKKLRYDACGVAFHKSLISQLYNNRNPIPDAGVRPVIYERSDLAKQFLPVDQHWRIVNFDIRGLYYNEKIVDWTHEREWRLLGSLSFEYQHITVLLRDFDQYKEFMSKIDIDIVKQLRGIVCLDTLLY